MVNIKKHFFILLLFFAGIYAFAAVGEAEWYISNGAGMALEKAFPLRALREKNALCIRVLSAEELPKEIRKYYTSPWKISCSILYEDGVRVKTQWVFRDESNVALFVAAISDDGTGFIEWYNDKGLIVEEQRLDADGSGYFISYNYKDTFLLKAVAHVVEAVPKEEAEEDIELPEDDEKIPGIAAITDETEETGDEVSAVDIPVNAGTASVVPEEKQPRVAELARNPAGPAEIPEFFVAATGREGGELWTDSYRYTRNASLRSIERVFHDKEAARQLVRFPRFVQNDITKSNFSPNDSPSNSEFLDDVFSKVPAKVTYTTDRKQRILTEVRRDEDDEIIGEITNTWEDDRLASVAWKSKSEDRIIEYGYNIKGERISERDIRNGVLERTVIVDGEMEIESLYKEGKLVLRSVWQEGRKISEERIPVRSGRK